MTEANRSSPELPNYDHIVAHGQHWRDLIGYHTRYGDVRELLAGIDDRYVIACGGDEIVLRFKAPAGPTAGWKRDFIWVSDGWVKDGDLNTRFGKTVLPLPSHDAKSYDTPPGRLEDDPVYKKHAARLAELSHPLRDAGPLRTRPPRLSNATLTRSVSEAARVVPR